MHLRQHFHETKELLEEVSAADVASWLLQQGYFPERYVLPPSFQVSDFKLQPKPYYNDLSGLSRRKIETISYPKTLLTDRRFGVIHPWNYHDIVFYLYGEWTTIINHLFHEDQRIYSYSLPIPVTKEKRGRVGNLRAGRMIYEWVTMAEKDLILDAGKYQFIVRTDITNFYSSIYTHTIPWVLHGRENALKDKGFNLLLGSKIDQLLQYANDARTNGVAIGPALTDLISEIILASVDVEVSRKIGDSIDFTAARFKDDYYILCKGEKEGQQVIQVIADVLSEYNLVLNERKTTILQLPDGIYRSHDRDYFPHSLKDKRSISFKVFEHTLLITLDIHRQNPGTSILEKFVSEIFCKNKRLKIQFSKKSVRRSKEIKKMVELLFFVKRESQKLLCHVLSVCEQLYVDHKNEFPWLKEYLADRVKYELQSASQSGSTFEVVWYIFFSRFVGLGIKEFDSLVQDQRIKENGFYKSILASQQKFFKDSHIGLFAKPKECSDESLAKQIAVFD